MSSLKPATLSLTLVLGLAPSSPAQQKFTVTVRGLATISIDGGGADGLKVGDRLRVMSGPEAVAEVEIVSLAERWSSCRTVSLTRPINLGDTAVPVSRAPALPASNPAAPGVASLAPGVAVADPPPTSPAPRPAATPTPVPAPVPPAKAAFPPPLAAPESPAAAPAPPPPAGGRRFTVKYRSAANVYLDAGRAAGLGVGDRLRVGSGAATVAELEVAYTAELSASCTIVSETRPVRAGDVAVLVTPGRGAPAAASSVAAASPAPVVPAAAPAPSPSPKPGAKRAAPWGRVRGSAAVGYYRSGDDAGTGLDFQERTARLDLGVYDIAGQPLSFTLRGRSRQDIRARTLSPRTPESERTDRLYEAALRYEPPSDRVGFEVGRIGIYRFVGIGYLDGFLGRYRPLPGVQVGAFGGRVADIGGFGSGSPGEKYGGFVRLAPGGRYASGPYDVMLAFVRENADGEVSREYLSLESSVGKGGRWSLFERAELDLNTGWRKDLTSKSAQLSNVSLSGNLRVTPSAWAFVSYDGRRNYRYYQNRVVPEEVFDGLLHQGLRAGLNVSKAGGFGATAGFGMSLKEPDPRHPELDVANAYSGNAGLRHANLFSTGFSAGIDGSGFSNGYTDGGLLMARLGRRFAAGHTLDLSFGRSLYRLKLTEQDRSTQWLRLSGRGELGRRVYLQGDFEYDSGDDLQGPRGFLELGVLF
jgi:hypothetical protein